MEKLEERLDRCPARHRYSLEQKGVQAVLEIQIPKNKIRETTV
jgi:hypothetical protein